MDSLLQRVAAICCYFIHTAVDHATGRVVLSEDGLYRMRYAEVSQRTSPFVPNSLTANLTFRLDPAKQAPPVPGGPATALDEDDPLIAAWLSPTEAIVTEHRSGIVENFHPLQAAATGYLELLDLPVGVHARELYRVDLAVTLIHVTEWETLRFPSLGLGTSADMPCGPCMLSTTGAKNRFSVATWGVNRVAAKVFEARDVLNLVHHRYVTGNLEFRDARDRELASTLGMSTGGSSGQTYIRYPDPLPAGVVTAYDSGEEIAYPVSGVLRLPLKFETERLTFTFHHIPLPAPKE